MARDEDRQGIAVVGQAYGARGARLAETLCNLPVAHGLSVGDAGELFPHLDLEWRAAKVERHLQGVRVDGLSGEVAIEPAAGRGEALCCTLQGESGCALQFCRKLSQQRALECRFVDGGGILAAHEHDCAESGLAGGEHQAAHGAGVVVVDDVHEGALGTRDFLPAPDGGHRGSSARVSAAIRRPPGSRRPRIR